MISEQAVDNFLLAILNIMECPQLEEIPSLVKLNYLERITIDECGKLQSITGIEELR